MTARSDAAPFKGRIQKRKTNRLQIIKSSLQRTAGPYSWVQSAVLEVGQPVPVFPDKQTFSVTFGSTGILSMP
jgi:hypothetical protein